MVPKPGGGPQSTRGRATDLDCLIAFLFCGRPATASWVRHGPQPWWRTSLHLLLGNKIRFRTCIPFLRKACRSFMAAIWSPTLVEDLNLLIGGQYNQAPYLHSFSAESLPQLHGCFMVPNPGGASQPGFVGQQEDVPHCPMNDMQGLGNQDARQATEQVIVDKQTLERVYYIPCSLGCRTLCNLRGRFPAPKP
jgi:hypothetical protein